MVAAEIASNRVPVEQLGVERSVVAAVERIGQHFLGAGVGRGSSFLEPGVRFAEGEHVEKIRGGAALTLRYCSLPRWSRTITVGSQTTFRFPEMRIAEINPQGNERVRDGGDDGGVWIRHGIQQLAADSVILIDIDQKQPSLLTGAMDGRVQVTLPRRYHAAPRRS